MPARPNKVQVLCYIPRNPNADGHRDTSRMNTVTAGGRLCHSLKQLGLLKKEMILLNGTDDEHWNMLSGMDLLVGMQRAERRQDWPGTIPCEILTGTEGEEREIVEAVADGIISAQQASVQSVLLVVPPLVLGMIFNRLGRSGEMNWKQRLVKENHHGHAFLVTAIFFPPDTEGGKIRTELEGEAYAFGDPSVGGFGSGVYNLITGKKERNF